MDSQKREMIEKRLIRWLLIAALALLICVLGLQARQLLRSGPVSGSGALSEDAAPSPDPKTEASQPSDVPADPGGRQDLIGEDAAKAAAFAHAGVREEDAVRVRCKLEWDDGLQIYEVEFDAGRLEYEYEIDAAAGTVLKAEVDN